MAIEKILNTRIKNKIDTLENWNKSTIGLLPGELAIATIAASAGTGLTEPVVMIKVGEDGAKTFKDLSWNIYAKASDVVAAAKSEDALTAFINNVINSSDLASNEAFTELKALVGTEAVADQIATAVADYLPLAGGTMSGDVNMGGYDITNAEEVNANALCITNTSDDSIIQLSGESGVLRVLTDAEGFENGMRITDISAPVDELDVANKGYVDEKIAEVSDYVGAIPDDYSETDIVAYINKKAQETLETASGGSSESAASVLAALNTYKAENDPKVAANTEAIADLEELVGTTAVATQISTAVAAEKTRAEGVEGGLETRLAAVEGDYLKASDKTALQNQITTNANAIERLTNGASAEEVDGVNDLIQYVKDHGTEVTGMKNDIKDNADAISAEATRATGVEGGLDTRLKAIEAIDIADKDYVDGLNTSMDTRVDAVESKAHEHGNKALLDTYTQTEADLADAVTKKHSHDNATVLDGITAAKVSAWDAAEQNAKDHATGLNTAMDGRMNTVEGKAHEHSNKTVLDSIEAADITAWDAKVDSVTAAANSGLKATRTGNAVAIEIDESVTFVFDCGGAGV